MIPPVRLRRAARTGVALAVLLATSACGILLQPGSQPTPHTTPSIPQPTATEPTGLPDEPDRGTAPLPLKPLPGMKDPQPGATMARFDGQQVAWRRCGRYECADVLAPLDYDNPAGPAITLRVTRLKHEGSDLGPLFVNPGGPGAPASSLLGADWKALGRYDVVAVDPRGSGASTPIVCEARQGDPQPQIDDLTSMDISPDDDAEYAALVAANRAFAQDCAANSGAYLGKIDSGHTVEDFDLVRRLLKAPKLNYVGYSYGTYLGALYASRHPDTVGRMVLDSAVNITDDVSIIQAQGFDRALHLFAAWEANRPAHLLGATADDVLAKVQRLLDDLDATPLPAGDRQLTQQLGATGVILPLYGQETSWRSLEVALDTAINRHDGTKLLALADEMNNRADDGSYDEFYYAFPSILCADSSDHGLAYSRDQWRSDEQKAPIFGKYLGVSTLCEVWPVRTQPPAHLTAPTAPPIVVVGSTGDPATPYEYAAWMAKQLGTGVLVTWDGPGHGTYGGSSTCVNGAVEAYLVDGRVPAAGLVCKP